MLQTFVVAAVPSRVSPDVRENDFADPLWRLAGDMRNARALVIADHGLDLMCGLIKRGCLAATVLRCGDKPYANDYNLVLVPLASALPSLDHVIRLARRALGPTGRLIAGVSSGKAAIALARRLRLNGFSVVQSAHLPGLILLRAELRSQA